ncbi:Fe-S cluster assembly protein SufD [bacterium]|nr:MAG: Fe-S cluster assembly protein SufD [bacterium]
MQAKETLQSLIQNHSFQLEFLSDYRNAALERFKSIKFPTNRDEEWRFLNLKDIARADFKLSTASNIQVDVTPYLLEEAIDSTLVFVNGFFRQDLSRIENLPKGACLKTFSDAGEPQYNELETHLGSLIHPKDDFFVELNSAIVDNGVLVFIPKETKFESPVHILNLVTKEAEGAVIAPRCVILADAFAKATIIEDFIGLGEFEYLNIPVAEIRMAEGAHLQHYRIQRESKKAFHINRLGTKVDQNADYQSYTIHFGAKVSRSDVRADLTGEQSNSILDGLVLINGEQESDTHTLMHHQQPNCTSHQLHKVVVDDKAHSVFNGKIWVDQIAQKTDSFQENRNILLSDNGTVDTKPQLEIFADDVRCSHGATVGQLDEEEVFYLKSRGLDELTSKELLIYGYALEVIENLEVESLKKQLSAYVSTYAHQVTEHLPA